MIGRLKNQISTVFHQSLHVQKNPNPSRDPLFVQPRTSHGASDGVPAAMFHQWVIWMSENGL